MCVCVPFENYLRDLIEKNGKEGSVVIQNHIAAGIAEYIEKTRNRVAVVRCKDCEHGFLTKNGFNEDAVMCCYEHSPASMIVGYVVGVDWYCPNGIPKEEAHGTDRVHIQPGNSAKGD